MFQEGQEKVSRIETEETLLILFTFLLFSRINMDEILRFVCMCVWGVSRNKMIIYVDDETKINGNVSLFSSFTETKSIQRLV